MIEKTTPDPRKFEYMCICKCDDSFCGNAVLENIIAAEWLGCVKTHSDAIFMKMCRQETLEESTDSCEHTSDNHGTGKADYEAIRYYITNGEDRIDWEVLCLPTARHAQFWQDFRSHMKKLDEAAILWDAGFRWLETEDAESFQKSRYGSLAESFKPRILRLALIKHAELPICNDCKNPVGMEMGNCRKCGSNRKILS